MGATETCRPAYVAGGSDGEAEPGGAQAETAPEGVAADVDAFLLPWSVIDSTRPFHWPWPSRLVTVMPVRLPSAGQAFSMAPEVTVVDQVWTRVARPPVVRVLLAGR